MKSNAFILIAFAVGLLVSAAVIQLIDFAERPGPDEAGPADVPFAVRLGDPNVDPGDDPRIDFATQCLLDTQVRRFAANPAVVPPFADTTLSWDVVVPGGCPVALSIAGRKVGRTGTLGFTPLHESNRIDLVGSILGGRGTLASTQVSVDSGACVEQEIPANLVAPEIVEAIEAFDKADDDFKLVEGLDNPRILLQANGLFITVVVKADITLFPDATVTLDMGLRFTVRDGEIRPRYILFRPSADTALPDDFVESKFFDRSGDILADFKRGFNEAIGTIVDDDEQLFDLLTEQSQLRAVICPLVRPEPRLTVQLSVSPAGDPPARFNLRVDGVTRAANQTNGGSTGPLAVAAGSHTVSQSAGTGTDLADYKSFIGGDCGLNGGVTLAPGDVKVCFITNIEQDSPEQCLEDCEATRELCKKDGELDPKDCVALFNICKATCN